MERGNLPASRECVGTLTVSRWAEFCFSTSCGAKRSFCEGPALCDPMDYSLLRSSVHGDSSGRNTGVGCHALLQGISPTQGSNPGLPHRRRILDRLRYQGSPRLILRAQPRQRGQSWWLTTIQGSPASRNHLGGWHLANSTLSLAPHAWPGHHSQGGT